MVKVLVKVSGISRSSRTVKKRRHHLDAFNPRFLLKSPDSEVIVSYNIHPAHSGFNAAEMFMWNGDEASWDTIEVRFEETGPVVQRSPLKCTACHGDPPLPRWAPRPFWPGQTPLSPNNIKSDTRETKEFLSLLGRIEQDNGTAKTLWSVLRPSTTVRQLEGLLSKEKSGEIPQGWYSSRNVGKTSTNESLGPSFHLFNELSDQNFCRISQNLSDHPHFHKFKFALVASIVCSSKEAEADPLTSLRSFFPQDVREVADDVLKAQGFDSLQQKASAIRKRHELGFANRIDRQREIFRKRYGSSEIADQEIEKLGLIVYGDNSLSKAENKAINEKEMSFLSRQVAQFDYVLRPFGVEMENWGITRDPRELNFGGNLAHILHFEPFEPLLEMECSELQKASHEALSEVEPHDCIDPAKVAPFESSLREIKGVVTHAMRQNVSEILKNNGCSDCHTERVFNAPDLLFSDLEAFEERIKKWPGYADVVWGRVSRGATKRRHMPLFREPLGKEDLEALNQYLSLLKHQ